MAFNISHQPNMASYAKAVEGASRNITANNRMQQYASYLAGVQKTNQDYGLGMAGLDVEREKVDKSLEIDKFRALLDEKKLGLEAERAKTQDKATLIQAYAAQDRATASLLGAHKTFFIG